MAGATGRVVLQNYRLLSATAAEGRFGPYWRLTFIAERSFAPGGPGLVWCTRRRSARPDGGPDGSRLGSHYDLTGTVKRAFARGRSAITLLSRTRFRENRQTTFGF